MRQVYISIIIAIKKLSKYNYLLQNIVHCTVLALIKYKSSHTGAKKVQATNSNSKLKKVLAFKRLCLHYSSNKLLFH